MNVVETRGLTKSYRGKRAVDRLDLHVAQGDIYGFVGKNGAGKSTVMKMVCGPGSARRGRDRAVRRRAPAPTLAAEAARPAGSSRVGALIEAPGIVRQPDGLREPHGEGPGPGRGRRVGALPRGACARGPRGRGQEEGEGLLARHEAAAGPGARARGLRPTCCCSTSRSTAWTPRARAPCEACVVRLNQTLGVTRGHQLARAGPARPRGYALRHHRRRPHGARDDRRADAGRVRRQPARAHGRPGPRARVDGGGVSPGNAARTARSGPSPSRATTTRRPCRAFSTTPTRRCWR